ncbi:hypothetical protein A4G27_16945 [Mycobacterium kansasii]|nr:hypothetical protein A4G27_16945 [Mycobacterium kansasii]
MVFREPGVVKLETVADPPAGPGEVVIEVAAAGVCGTDHHLVAGELGVPAGTIPGHETAGCVVEISPDVDGVAVGDRVVCYGQVVCGRCEACRSGHDNRCTRPQGFGMARPGGFAEYLAAPASCLLPLPDGVEPEIGAIATDAIATPFHALDSVGAVRPGERVVVVGTGGLGLHAVALARLMGAGRVVAADPSPQARSLALAAGADDVLDPAAVAAPGRELRALAGGAHAAFEFVGRADTVELALQSLTAGGRLVVVGVGHDRPRLPPIIRFVGMELAVRGSFGSTRTDIAAALALVAAGRLDVSRSVSRRVDLDEAPDVFNRPACPARTVITPHPPQNGTR